MSNVLAKAKGNYTDYLSGRTEDMQRLQQAKERVGVLEREISEQERHIDVLKTQNNELINECAINPKIESKLDANDKEVRDATALLDRKKKMLAAARQASDTPIPSIEDGQALLVKLGEAAASHVIEKHEKDIKLVKAILTDAFASWSFISYRDEEAWRSFLRTVFDMPTDNDLDKASDKFKADIVTPIEEAAQKEYES